MKKELKICHLLIYILFFVSCAHHQIIIQEPAEILDIEIYPQNFNYYVSQIDSTLLPNLSIEKQSELDSLSNKLFYSVWTDTLNTDNEKVIELFEYYQSLFERYKKKPGYAENKLPRDSLNIIEILNNANLNQGFNTFKKAITTEYTDIRVLPTNKPYFYNHNLAGEGFPFDYWQNSTIPIGTPIFIYHETKHWALIGSHICHGWIPKNKIAYVNDEQVSKIINLPLIAILKDNQELKTIYNKYIGKADIGTIFPLLSEMDNCYNVLFFERDSLANANEINLQISKDISAQKPIPLNIENIHQICQQMQGQLYGWGGMYLNRDCSQTMLDMFMPFGILLPRNSKQQANNGGFSVDISDLNIKEKKKFIISNAKPFTTLIGLPGHIMLYIGHIENEPIVFHNMWGIKTLHRKNEGRFVVGKAVITSLEPGKELKYVKKNTTLINRINKLTFIIP
jgi:hypothetical protein